MDIGFGTFAALWLLSGVLSWSGLVVMGLGFRLADEDERMGLVSAAASEDPLGAHGTSRHAVARTRG